MTTAFSVTLLLPLCLPGRKSRCVDVAQLSKTIPDRETDGLRLRCCFTVDSFPVQPKQNSLQQRLGYLLVFPGLSYFFADHCLQLSTLSRALSLKSLLTLVQNKASSSTGNLHQTINHSSFNLCPKQTTAGYHYTSD